MARGYLARQHLLHASLAAGRVNVCTVADCSPGSLSPDLRKWARSTRNCQALQIVGPRKQQEVAGWDVSSHPSCDARVGVWSQSSRWFALPWGRSWGYKDNWDTDSLSEDSEDSEIL